MPDATTLAILGAGGALLFTQATKGDKSGGKGGARQVSLVANFQPPGKPKSSEGKRVLRSRFVKPAVMAGQYGTQPVDQNDTRFAQEQIRQAEKELKKQYDKLEAEARKKGADAVNEALGTNLTGDESFEEAAKIIGAALGAGGAAAGCSAVGAAVVAKQCAVLGAMLGGYLGEKLGPWLKDQWGKVEDWASDQWDEVEGWAEETWDDFTDAISDLNPF